jgi:hypothetical protein
MREREHGQSSIGALRTLYYLVKVSLALVLLPPSSSFEVAEPETVGS